MTQRQTGRYFDSQRRLAWYLRLLNLLHLFDLSFSGRRDHTALEFQGDSYTFGDIDARSNRLAQLLAQRGLKSGDRL
jgi:malonyl-CoA/methylmalonyl-CoA synthetase